MKKREREELESRFIRNYSLLSPQNQELVYQEIVRLVEAESKRIIAELAAMASSDDDGLEPPNPCDIN